MSTDSVTVTHCLLCGTTHISDNHLFTVHMMAALTSLLSLAWNTSEKLVFISSSLTIVSFTAQYLQLVFKIYYLLIQILKSVRQRMHIVSPTATQHVAVLAVAWHRPAWLWHWRQTALQQRQDRSWQVLLFREFHVLEIPLQWPGSDVTVSKTRQSTSG